MRRNNGCGPAGRSGALAAELAGGLSVAILVFLGGLLLGFAVGRDAAYQEQRQRQEREVVPTCPCVAAAVE